jgi:hypothetical protein
MTTKTKMGQIQNAPTTVQIQAQNTTQTQNSPVQNTTTQTTTSRRVISITSRDGARGRPGRLSGKPDRGYIIAKLGELLVNNTEIDLGDYIAIKPIQVYVTSYTSNYTQGLLTVIAKHKEQEDVGLVANLAFRVHLTSGEVKVSVKNAIRLYNPLLSNLLNLTKDLDPAYVFK